MGKKQVVQDCLDFLDVHEGDGVELTIAELRSRLDALVDQVPEPYRKTARVKIRASGDYAHAYVELVWERPETNEEAKERQRFETKWQRESEERERREYERLKRKFGADS